MYRTGFALVGLLALVVAEPGRLAADEYRLQPSDVLELSVAGVDALQRRAPVDLDGNVVLPLAGIMHVEGKTIAQVRDEYIKHAESKSVDTETRDGVKAYFVEPDQVTIFIAEYRPVYITGDVSRPGEQPFRPGLTVRQAIAVAGGYDLLRFSSSNPFIESASLRSEYDALWIDFANAQSQLTRVVAELSGNETFDQSGFADLPVDDKLLDELAKSEAEQMRIRLAEIGNEKQHLQRLIDQSQSRLNLLNEEQTQVQSDREADQRDVDRITNLFDKGMTTADRMTAARQALFSSSVRFLSTTAEIGSAGESLEGFKRQLQKVDADRRLALLGELKEAKVSLAKTIADLGAVSEKLLYVGSTRTTLEEGLAGDPKIVVFDGRDAGKDGRIATESDPLRPGDFVQITLQPPPPAGSPPAKLGAADNVAPAAKVP